MPGQEGQQGQAGHQHQELGSEIGVVRRLPLVDEAQGLALAQQLDREHEQLRTDRVEGAQEQSQAGPGRHLELPAGGFPVEPTPDDQRPQEDEAHGERAVGVHPHPEDRCGHPRGPGTVGEDVERGQAHEAEQHRAFGPALGADQQDRHDEGGPDDDGPGGFGQAPEQVGQQRRRQRHDDPHPAQAGQVVHDRVDQRGQPGLDRPRLPCRREAVRVHRRDAAVQDEAPGGQVREEAVVDDALETDEEARQGRPRGR